MAWMVAKKFTVQWMQGELTQKTGNQVQTNNYLIFVIMVVRIAVHNHPITLIPTQCQVHYRQQQSFDKEKKEFRMCLYFRIFRNLFEIA